MYYIQRGIKLGWNSQTYSWGASAPLPLTSVHDYGTLRNTLGTLHNTHGTLCNAPGTLRNTLSAMHYWFCLGSTESVIRWSTLTVGALKK